MPRKKKQPEKMPARKAAEVVLINAGRPMHYREITRVALEQGLVKVRRGADPDATMKTVRSYLAGCAQKGEKFVRVDSGIFDLLDRPDKTEATP